MPAPFLRLATPFLAAALALAFAGAPAAALTIDLTSSIDGAQANMGNGTGSPAFGSATMTFDDVTNEFSWSGSYTGLVSNFFVAHFHGPALPGENAGVEVGFSVMGNQTGTFDGSATLSASQAADLLAGLWYINIHSTTFTGGEIRGQVLVVPEPALGFALVAGTLLIATRQRELA